MPYRAKEVVALAMRGGGFQVTHMSQTYSDDDELVADHGWAFEPVTDRPMERATARPGEKRVTRLRIVRGGAGRREKQ